MRCIKSLVSGSGRDQLCMRRSWNNDDQSPASMLPNFPRRSKRSSTSDGDAVSTHINPETLLSNHLDQHPLAPPAVELTIKNLFPRTEIQAALGDPPDHFGTHYLPLDVSIAIALASLVVAIAGFLRRQSFQEMIVILKQPLLIVIDIDTGRDMHGIDQHQTLLHTA